MRIAVLGCGSIGRRHLQNLHALGETDLLAFDPSARAREGVKLEFGIKCRARLSELWPEEPEVAFITAPSNMHLPLALEAARHNCHLFIEKPASTSLAGIESLQTEIERRKLVTMVGCNMRFHPGPAQLKQLLDEGAIGRPIAGRLQTGSYLPAWRPGADYRRSYSASADQGGGAILDCIHEIDLAIWYFGQGTVEGAAVVRATALGLEVEGLAEILIRHQSGVLSSVHLNILQRDYRRCCQIIGTEGSLYWDFEDANVRWHKSNGERQLFAQSPSWTVNQMYVDEVRYFLDSISNRRENFGSLESGIAALRVALAAKEWGTN